MKLFTYKANKPPSWFLWILTFLCVFLIWYLLSILNPIVVTYGDYVQYWAAGRLTILGENVYSAEAVSEIRQQLGINIDYPKNAVTFMLYPPWSIPFVIPFALFNFPLSRLVWFILQLCIIFICTKLIWDFYNGSKKLFWLSFVVAFSFTPTLYLFLMGHITYLHLLGIIGFLYFVRFPPKKWSTDLAAGACAALVTIKPQLLLIFMLAILIWVVENRRWMVLAGSTFAVLLFSLITVIIYPESFFHFWSAITNYSLGIWASPAIGTVVRRSFGYEREWLQLVPTIFGIVWFIYYWIKNHSKWDWLVVAPVLVLISFLTTPYMWFYDMALLLLPLLVLTIELVNRKWNIYSWLIVFSYLLISVATIYHFFFIHNNYYLFWLVPAYSLVYFSGMLFLKKYPLKIQSAVTLAY